MSVAALAAIQFGGYVNPYKVGGILVLLVVWVKLLAWIDKDSVAVFLFAGVWTGVWGAHRIIRGGRGRIHRDAVADDRPE
jgi:hypothetical protein